jgi:tetratricopeptide (TPR) repeat protein
MRLLQRKRPEAALLAALRWRRDDVADVMALVALGESLAALNQPALAARAYGSLIDLYPSRADMRRFAGQRLESLGQAGQALAADTYAEAARQRPDHPGSHRLLAFALLRLGRVEAAFAALELGLSRRYPGGRFEGVRQILQEDLGLVAAAWIARSPKRRTEIERRLRRHGARLEREPSLRFVLNWETDANDVDFHINDGRGGHAYYGNRFLPSGGELYADVTTGYGPECFTIRGKPRGFPYRLRIHYYSRGPMGYGMGKLEIVQHDGAGGFKFEQRPFVVMNDGAYVDLGKVPAHL